MKQNTRLDYDLISKDYDINGAEDDNLYRLKKALNILTPVEKKIMLTYCELGSYAAVAREFNVSCPTARKYLDEVRNKMLAYLGL